MAEAKHTPGPWVYDDEECDVYADRGGDDEQTICSLMGDANAEENGRLIAASPNLLAACEYIVGRARKHTDGTVRLDAGDLDIVRMAIADAAKA